MSSNNPFSDAPDQPKQAADAFADAPDKGVQQIQPLASGQLATPQSIETAQAKNDWEQASKDLAASATQWKDAVAGFQATAGAPVRAFNEVRKSMLERGVPDPAKPFVQQTTREEDAALSKFIPESVPSSAGGYVGAAIGTVADVPSLVAGGVGGSLVLKGGKATGLLASEAEKAAFDSALYYGRETLNKAVAENAANALSKEALKEGLLHGAGAGAAIGGTQGFSSALQEKRSLAEGTLEGAVVGGLGGAVLEGAAKGLLSKRAMSAALKEIPETFVATSTPARQALEDQLSKSLTEQAELNWQLKEAKGPKLPTLTQEERIKAAVDRANAHLAELPQQLDNYQQTAKGQLQDASDVLEGKLIRQKAQLSDLENLQQQPERLSALEGQREVLRSQLDQALREGNDLAASRVKSRLDDLNDHIADLQSAPTSAELTYSKRAQLASQIQENEATLAQIKNSQQGRTDFGPQVRAVSDYQSRVEANAKELGAKASQLADQREALLEKLKGIPGDPAQVAAVQEKLRANLEQLALLQNSKDKLDFVAAKVGKTLGVGDTGFDLAVKKGIGIAQAQAEKAKSVLASLERFTPEQLNEIYHKEFTNALSVQGITAKPFELGELSGAADRVLWANEIDKKAGSNVAGAVINSFGAKNLMASQVADLESQYAQHSQALRKMGMTPEQIARSLEYITKEGFNPKPTFSKPPYWGSVPPAPAQMEHLQAMQQLYDQLHQSAVASGFLDREQYIPGYVPHYQNQAQVPLGRSIEGIENPAFAQSRLGGALDPLQHETDDQRIFSRYVRAVKFAEHMSPIVDQYVDELAKLRILGGKQNNFAQARESVQEYVKKAFNLKTDRDLEALFGNNFAKRESANFQGYASAQGIAPSAMKEVLQQAGEAYYRNLTTQNPTVIAAHALQPEFLVSGEVGPVAYAKGRAQALLPGYREEAKKLLPLLGNAENPSADILAMKQAETGPGRLYQKVNNFVGKGDAVFNKVQTQTKLTAILAAYSNFDSKVAGGVSQGIQKLGEQMLPAEARYMQDAFQKGGLSAARDAYAVLVHNKTIGVFDALNRPELLPNYAKFTTIPRMIINNFAGDILSGNYKKVAQRIASQYVAAKVIGAISGGAYKKGDSPEEVAGSLTRMSLLPPGATDVLQTGRDLYHGDWGKALKNLREAIPGYTPASKLLGGSK